MSLSKVTYPCFAKNPVGEACECKDFGYELGDHPGICFCNHSDLDHARDLNHYEEKRRETEAHFAKSLERQQS